MKGYGDIYLGGLGYGDITNVTPILERGYGSPFLGDLYFLESTHTKVYHNGGAEIVISGLVFEDLAPYQASINLNGQILYFDSGVAGQGFNVYPQRGKLYFYSPPAPVGAYSLNLRYGLNLTQSTLLNIDYVNDNKGVERYRTNKLYPAHFATGARASELDPINLGVSVPEEPFLVTLNDTVGRVFQEIGGNAMSRTINHTARGESVLTLESVLGFKPVGFCYVNKDLLTYTLNTPNSSLILDSPLKQAVREGAQIHHHVK